jgi:signal peptidase I
VTDAPTPERTAADPKVTAPAELPVSAAPRPRRYRLAVEIAETLVVTGLLFLGIQTFVAQPFQVKQHSMERTLESGQYVLVDKLTPLWAPYGRGDIIVFRPPEAAGDTVPLIKRVIGLPGDTVEVRDGLVFVNGTALDEGYLYRGEDGQTEPTDPSFGGTTAWQVPPGQLLVMGDHRQDSSDSRVFGPIAVADVVGRAWLRYWPFDVFGVLSTPLYPELGP